MKKRIPILLLCALLLGLCACGADDSAVTELTFRDLDGAPEELLGAAAYGEDLSEAEVESLLTGAAFRDYEGFVSLNADGTLCSAEVLQETESKSGAYMVARSMIHLYPGALPSGDLQPTCTVCDTPVDAYRWKTNGATCFTAAFVRPDTGIAVWATVFCNSSEGDRRADCIARLYEITEACLKAENTLTFDSVYSGPDFPRQSETALVPASLETEAACRAGAQQAMERYQAACALDPAVPAECACDAMIIRAVSPAGDQMLVDAQMAYLPSTWDFSDMDDAFRFPDGGVPMWYDGQTVLRRGVGERAECLVGMQSFRMERGTDGVWQISGTGGPVTYWIDQAREYDSFARVRWTV